MKTLAAFAAFALLSTAAYADGPRSGSASVNIASRGGVVNSATISQTAGAIAFAQVAQGERAFIDAPRYDPVLQIKPGGIIMPYVGINGDDNTDARVIVFDPVGSIELD